MKTIGMVVALEKEILPLLEKLDVKIRRKSTGKFSVTEFSAANKRIIAVNSGVGEIRAAAATQYLITAYSPDVIINFGVCGSLLPDLGLKTVVLVGGVVHYDFDTSAVDGTEIGRYLEYPTAVVKTDERLLKKASEIIPDAKSVICASGDKFIADAEKKRYLAAAFGASVCDMESAGVLLTADANGVPVLMVKAVSDGEGGASDYVTTVREATKRYVDFLVKFAESV